ncbi:hypothetical protein ACYOEI_25610 [Singulisphaera rosea]
MLLTVASERFYTLRKARRPMKSDFWKCWRTGPNPTTHRAIVRFLRSISTNSNAQQHLGYAGKNDAWASRIRSSIPFAERIEDLAPALAQERMNPEYPWPRANPQDAPAEEAFEIWSELKETSKGRQFIEFLRTLLNQADAYL